ncbi:MAG: efflux RND transporter periplasmic adaptor subunit [Bacteroidales bacterium]|nr:efflux RND transporter periplasmic adaptor subunit [Bacteroidales bacterium]
MNRFVYIILIAFAGFSFVSCGKKKVNEPSKGQSGRGQIKVDAIITKPTLLTNQITISGSLLALEEVALMSEMAGRVVQINLPEGKLVRKGTLLVQLYNDDLLANLKKLQAQLDVQEKIYQRQSDLLKVDGISQSDFDQTSLDVNTIKAGIEVQQTLIRKSQILAPFDGIIGLRNISVGAQISPSTQIATIRMEDKLKLDFSVPEKYSSEIKPGLNVKFTVYGKDTEYDATVIATEGGIDATTRNIKVRALVNSKSEELVPGAFTNVQLTLGENKDAILIPTQAIIPQERNKSVIVSKKGKAHFVLVKTGVRKESMVEITDGINVGDTVVTNGLLFLKEGAKLSFSNVKN